MALQHFCRRAEHYGTSKDRGFAGVTVEPRQETLCQLYSAGLLEFSVLLDSLASLNWLRGCLQQRFGSLMEGYPWFGLAPKLNTVRLTPEPEQMTQFDFFSEY